MKPFVLLASALCFAMCSFAQNDTATQKSDTIRVGNMIIIKRSGHNGEGRQINFTNRQRKKLTNISTNWFIPDLGFANYTDHTNYTLAQQSGFVSTGITGKDNLKLRTGKSVDVNIWLFMTKVNLIKHYVNLKYGLGVELNNYRFDDDRVRFSKNPTKIFLDNSVDKNKLAANYVTLPAMLNFNFTPNKKHNFGFSTGMSIGYLYDAHEKIKDNGKKTKLHDDFNLERWKLSYVAELSLGPVHLYGSLATKNMWEKGLDQTPYTVGIRFSHF